MPNKTIRVGVIGVGQIGKEHLETYLSIPEVKVVAIAGRSPDRTQRIAQNYNIQYWTTDFRELLARDDIDAVSVCLHNNLHREATVSALEAVSMYIVRNRWPVVIATPRPCCLYPSILERCSRYSSPLYSLTKRKLQKRPSMKDGWANLITHNQQAHAGGDGLSLMGMAPLTLFKRQGWGRCTV